VLKGGPPVQRPLQLFTANQKFAKKNETAKKRCVASS
jgi:hypothetical protein